MKVRLKPANLRRILAEKNMTETQLIRRSQISDGYLSQLMRGIRNPSPKLRQRFMRILGVTNFNVLFQLQS